MSEKKSPIKSATITSSGHTIDSRVAMDEIRELLNSATGPIKVMMQ